MTTDKALTVADDPREAALLKALGLDRVPPEQRELALGIAKRYDLDPMLRHVILIDGRPFITRDGLLWVAHRSGQFDGMEVTEPDIIEVAGKGTYWRATCSVYRKDMSRPFVYTGRYPTKGGNEKYGPEMAIKVAESMALRRAFNVAAPVEEERWDALENAPVEPPKPLIERIAARKAEVIAVPVEVIEPGPFETNNVTVAAAVEPHEPPKPAQCAGFSDELGRCRKAEGHDGPHKSAEGVWPQ